MKTRIQLFATLLPIAAIGLLAVDSIGSDEYMAGPSVVAEATMLDAAPRGRGPVRGARAAPAQPADVPNVTTDDTAHYEGHPRRQDGSRALPQTETSLALTDDEPRITAPRGARS